MKNKFALCFRPVGIEAEEADREHHRVSDHDRDRDVTVSKSIVVSKDHNNTNMPLGILQSRSPKFSCHPRRKNGSEKTLSRVLKSFIFETSSRIRVNGDGIIRQTKFLPKDTNGAAGQSNESLNAVDDPKPVTNKNRDVINIQQVSSSSFSSTTSGVFSSSSSANISPSSESNDDSKSLKKRAFARSRSNSFDQKKKPKTTKTNNKTCSSKGDVVFYVILLALLATILWGKCYAVLFTSLCLYIIPMWWNGFYGRAENAVKLPERETSKEHKKRVIMEGLLERKPIQRALIYDAKGNEF